MKLATPMVLGLFTEMTHKQHKEYVSLKGVYPNYDQIENPHIVMGRFIQMADVVNQRRVCVLSKNIASRLFPNDPNPLGKYVQSGGMYLRK